MQIYVKNRRLCCRELATLCKKYWQHWQRLYKHTNTAATILSGAEQVGVPQRDVLPLHPFEEGQAVTLGSWLGCIEQIDVEYTIQVQTGYTFRHSDHKSGVSIERRATVCDRYQLYPGLRVTLTEYLASKLVERYTGEGHRTVNLGLWQRGVVLHFEVMGVLVNMAVYSTQG